MNRAADAAGAPGTAAPSGVGPAGLPAAVKRLVDVMLAGLVFVLAGPILLVAAGLVRVRMGAPVLFVQERTGRSMRHFRLLKLRTMTDARDAQGRLLPDRDRARPLGGFLRRYSIDELPQLINVLRGEMSLIGPRPLLPRYDSCYAGPELLRFAVRPGITGLAQVTGRNAASWNDRLALDARYVAQWSLWLDARIALRTVGRVFASSGVSADPAGDMLDLDEERGMSRP
ncbi:sugar transferase [Rugosimonospora acidiphila]|uniref:Sugar transferase n=1 Tax=Rugosimonospora acidiphila TaxID=556531 RepID=A0ABP9SKJ2_9ACTN